MRNKGDNVPFLTSGLWQSKIDRPWFSAKRGSGDAGAGVRLGLFKWLVIVCAAVLGLRLFFLTVVHGGENRELAEGNRIRLVEVTASRGKILARNGEIMADSVSSFQLIPAGGNAKPVVLTDEQAAELSRQGLAGEDYVGDLGRLSRQVERFYPLSLAASHVVGYTDADLVPKTGIEQAFDDFLRGINGKRLIEVDAGGGKVSILGREEPVAGRDVTLTIDAGLQNKLFEALKKQVQKTGSGRGAAVAQDPATGEVLAMVSLPAFDPARISESLDAPNQPFLNRVIAGMYPPGSVFKIVSALAGLTSGKIDENTEIEDVGQFFLGNTRFANWYYLQNGGRDGVLKLARAIARSNDIFFYRLAERVGLDKIRSMAQALGFGQKTGIDIAGEEAGNLPDEVWKRFNVGEEWFLGDTLHFSIGQGYVLATPLQLNSMVSFAARGKLTKPYLVSKISGEKEITMEKQVRDGPVAAKDLDVVRRGMRQACEKGGTGWPFFEAPYAVGCKTGTAEKSLGNPHAWFSVFAPYDDPQITMTVLVEDGGEGSSVAGPVAREVLDWWITNKIKN